MRIAMIVIGVFLFNCEPERPRVFPSATITHGEAFFLNECARCHGDRGEGNPEKEVPRLRNNKYDPEEVKNVMLYPEGIMPEFENVEDSIIVQIVQYINEN